MLYLPVRLCDWGRRKSCALAAETARSLPLRQTTPLMVEIVALDSCRALLLWRNLPPLSHQFPRLIGDAFAFHPCASGFSPMRWCLRIAISLRQYQGYQTPRLQHRLESVLLYLDRIEPAPLFTRADPANPPCPSSSLLEGRTLWISPGKQFLGHIR